MKRVAVGILFAAGFLLFSVWGLCQGNLGGLTGRITDATGAVIPETTVVVTNLDTETAVTVASTSDGVYLVQSIPPGRYRISATKAGFKTLTQEPILISTATVATVDLSMTIGETTQSVTVTAQLVALQTSSSEVGTVMSDQSMLDLPISLGGNATIGATGRRQIENFIFLTPGVTGNQWSKNINGAPGFSQEILIDGEDMQNIGAPGFIAESSPPYEAVSEFKVQNTLYPAEYGSGFGIENFTLKSGGNGLHGDGFDFLRNNVLDSRNFFSNYVPVIRQNEFGGTVGGPVDIPKVYNGKQKTFFFFAYSGFRLRGGLPPAGLDTLPTAQERQGNFSDYPYPIYDPATTAPDGSGGFTRSQINCDGALNVICGNRLSGVAQRTIALLPPVDIPNTYFNNYIDRSNQPSTDNDYSVKIDHTINDKQRISGGLWIIRGNTQINGGIAGPLDPGFRNTPTTAEGYRINHEYTITPTLLNHAGFGYTPTSPTWSRWTLDPRLGNQVLQIPGIPADAHGYPALSFDQLYAGLGNADNNGTDPQFFQNWNFVDDLSWVRGKHQIKVGMEYRFRKMTLLDQRNVGGTFNFDAMDTSLPDSPNFTSYGNAFASFELGQVYSASAAIPAPLRHFTDQWWAMYAEDTIKVTSKLTLSLGLRYELPVYATEEQGQLSLLSLTTPNPGAGGLPGALIYLGNGTGRTGTENIFGSYHKAFSPRIGLAYAADSKTVVRLGYGVFRVETAYGRLNGCNFWCSGFGLNPAYSSTNSGVTPAFDIDSPGFPASNVTLPDFDPSLNNNGAVSYVNSSAYKMAYNQSWTVDIQRDLPYRIMLDVAYIGEHTTGLWTGEENLNQVNPSYLSLGSTLLDDINSPQAVAAGITSPYAGFSGSVAQALRPFPQYTTLYDMYQPTGYNDYDSLQVRLQKRYSNGLSFLGAYTLSKNIGMAGGDIFGDPDGGGGLMGLNTFNRRIEKTVLPINEPNVFVFSWSYDAPFGKGKRFLANVNPVLNEVVGGWQVNSIESYNSGTPIGVGGGGNIPLFGGGNRPNWISGNVRTPKSMGSFDPAVDLYLNINAFSQPAPYTFGSAPPELPDVRTPAYADEDFSIFKKFPLKSETKYLEFRAEFFDIFNRVVFGGPAANINSPTTFGIIGGQANSPRVIQFAFKIVF